MNKNFCIAGGFWLILSVAACGAVQLSVAPDPGNPSTPWGPLTLNTEYWIPVWVSGTGSFDTGFALGVKIASGDTSGSDLGPRFVYDAGSSVYPMESLNDPRTSDSIPPISLTVPTHPVLHDNGDSPYSESLHQYAAGGASVTTGTVNITEGGAVLAYLRVNTGSTPGTYALTISAEDSYFSDTSSGDPIYPTSLIHSSLNVAPVPEPATVAVLVSGGSVLAGLFWFRRRRARRIAGKKQSDEQPEAFFEGE